MNKVIKFLGNRHLQWLFLLLGVVLISITSWQMSTLDFWGYRPLLWLAGLWLLMVGLLWRRISRDEQRIRRFILSTSSGLLLAVSFPTSPLTILVFIALVPLLLLIRDNIDLSAWRTFGHLYNAFFIWNILTTFWVLNTSFAPGIAANVINAGLMTVPWLIYKRTAGKFSAFTASMSLIAYWIAFEYLHMHWEISWPWLSLGNYFAQYPSWVQWYSITGFFGGAVWIFLANLGVVNTYHEHGTNLKSYSRVAMGIVIPIVLSLVMYWSYSDHGDPAEVVMVQPNYEPHYQKFEIPQSIQIRKMMSLASEAVDSSTDFLLFPETVIHRVKLHDLEEHRGIRAFQRMTMDHPDLTLVSGVSSIRTYGHDSLVNPSTRIYVDANGDTTLWDVQNAAISVRNGAVERDYFKSKLVPGAEIFPYKEWLPFIKPIIDQLQGSVDGLVTQSHREVFSNGRFNVGPVICYESIYGDFVGEYVREGANAIFIMTNDGWWDDTPGHKQHLAFARLRAIEHRRSIARAANTGISCFIDQRGDVHGASKYEEDAVLKASISMNSETTFYTLWGDYLAQISILLTIFLLIATYFPFLGKKRA